MEKFVYLFSEGNESMKELLGGKGANLAEMTQLGMPVPQGFTVTTQACLKYYSDNRVIAPEVEQQIFDSLATLEKSTGKKFGDNANPLLLSVRSGARASMPGMMDTVLNLGMNDLAVEGVAELTGNPRFAFDSYRRFIQMFSDVVMELPKKEFEGIIDELKERKGVELDTDLTADDMRELVAQFKEFYKKQRGQDFPQDPRMQLIEAVKAVFRSWDNPRAVVYRRMNDIPSSWGTAVNVQSMVFGNMGDDCGTGVAFSRDAATGEKRLYGEFLINAQGEDVVAGIRTPLPIAHLEQLMPEVYRQFVEIATRLESHYKDMQDMEFTIEKGTLYMLQTRNGKRTAAAALRIAVDLVEEGMLTPREAVLKVDPRQLDALLHPAFDADALKAATPVGKGLAASPGAATGKIYFTAASATAAGARGEKVILVRLETSPEDIEGMAAAQGILTARGGMTSHAAVVARGMGTCCVAGCGDLTIWESKGSCRIGDLELKEGDFISLDGSTGQIYNGSLPTVDATISGDFDHFMKWADELRVMKVRTNADTPHDSDVAVKFGCEGIGLCRTEHMFFEADRIRAVREMIVSKTEEQRRAALAKILPMQRGDFIGIFEAMAGRPVTIRLLDPPLHEFLPTDPADIQSISAEIGVSVEELQQTIAALHEFNPMMGHRGCRLAVTYPEIAEMQTTAIIEAALHCVKNSSQVAPPEIMIPLTGDEVEFKFVKDIIVKTADRLIAESGTKLDYQVGTMIEIPRACFIADEIAEEATFFSFGTNDLTQMGYGFSRDDAGKFLDAYYDKKIFESDPFAKLDQKGIGKMVEMAVQRGRSTNPELKIGVCGEHGGEPSSVEFFHRAGLNYVSCSPFRVPIARLAAAQAAIKYPR